MNTLNESCIPQNEDGFKYWVKSRLETLNNGTVIDGKYAQGATVDVTDPVVVPPVLTQAEKDANEWVTDYYKWLRVKTTLIDTGVVDAGQTQVVALKTKVQNNFKPAYLNLI